MDYYYYELLEMGRKFLLSGLMVFIRPGSPQQIAAAFIVSIFTLFYFVKSSPYVSSMIDNLQTISLASQAITLFCKSPSPAWDSWYDAMVVFSLMRSGFLYFFRWTHAFNPKVPSDLS